MEKIILSTEEAANQYRLLQAKELIENLLVSTDGGKTFKLAYERSDGGGHTPTFDTQNKSCVFKFTGMPKYANFFPKGVLDKNPFEGIAK